MISKEAKQRYDKERYFSKYKPTIFGERKCKACHILLKSRHGAYVTRTYCRSCRDNGVWKKIHNKEYYLKNRDKILGNI